MHLPSPFGQITANQPNNTPAHRTSAFSDTRSCTLPPCPATAEHPRAPRSSPPCHPHPGLRTHTPTPFPTLATLPHPRSPTRKVPSAPAAAPAAAPPQRSEKCRAPAHPHPESADDAPTSQRVRTQEFHRTLAHPPVLRRKLPKTTAANDLYGTVHVRIYQLHHAVASAPHRCHSRPHSQKHRSKAHGRVGDAASRNRLYRLRGQDVYVVHVDNVAYMHVGNIAHAQVDSAAHLHVRRSATTRSAECTNALANENPIRIQGEGVMTPALAYVCADDVAYGAEHVGYAAQGTRIHAGAQSLAHPPSDQLPHKLRTAYMTLRNSSRVSPPPPRTRLSRRWLRGSPHQRSPRRHQTRGIHQAHMTTELPQRAHSTRGRHAGRTSTKGAGAPGCRSAYDPERAQPTEARKERQKRGGGAYPRHTERRGPHDTDRRGEVWNTAHGGATRDAQSKRHARIAQTTWAY
ncbi:hypothetical protein C8J57DRAFT_1720634 [Mycena rebaudengoi]|nr:hypothetical protein C8J57DRAFT_1720634 [Mycena rebaudengoi]